MFNRKKQPPIKSLLGAGLTVRGELVFSDGLRIDGQVEGDVIATGEHSLLVVGESATVQGSVRAAHVIVNGRILGPVQATALLELQPKAHVVGDVSYQGLEMHQGAVIEGQLRPMGVLEEKPQLKLASSQG